MGRAAQYQTPSLDICEIMHFDQRDPLKGLERPPCSIWDAHIHVWDAAPFAEFQKQAHVYGVDGFMAIASPGVKHSLEAVKNHGIFAFARYLPKEAFAHHDADTLVEAVDEAYAQGYNMIKMWFGPRFLDHAGATKPFAISLPVFEAVFRRIEEYGLPIDIHVADPDIWYTRKYADSARYRTKRQAIEEFTTVLERHRGLRAVSVHFGSLPEEENLSLLASLLSRHENLYIDTASTKWIIRELGRNPERAREFVVRYRDRVLFASDLSVGWEGTAENYVATRYWAQRLFWETDVRGVELPFHDEDNEEGSTMINGLNLPEEILQQIYRENSARFFGYAASPAAEKP